MVHSQAHILYPFSHRQRQAIIRSGKRFGNPDVATTTIHLATQTQTPDQTQQDREIDPGRFDQQAQADYSSNSKSTPGCHRIFEPGTVLRWQSFPRTIGDRELVRKKWTYPNKNKGGRPSISKETEGLPEGHRDGVILRLARENSRLGYGKIVGELLKLGFQVSLTTVRNVLDRYGIQPASVRNGSIGWRHLMTHYKEQILACDFFTVETVFLQTIYVLFFIELGSRRVHFAGITSNPDQVWVTQQARQLVWELSDREKPLRFLIHDNDSSFCSAFDAVFESEGFHVIPTPVQAPNANAFSERWVRTVREECLDLILIMNAAHLRRVVIEFVVYYNTARPHQGIDQQTPIPQARPASGTIQCRNVLGGIIHDYYRASTPLALPAI